MVDRIVLGEGRFLRLVSGDTWEFVERIRASGVAVIVAVTADERLLLVEQHRPAVGGAVIELPAGLAGDSEEHAREALEAAARRELLEETGYEAEGMAELVAGPATPGIASEIVTFFQATGLRKVGAGGGAGSERITVHEVELPRVGAFLRQRAAAGVFVDPKVYAGLYFLEA